MTEGIQMSKTKQIRKRVMAQHIKVGDTFEEIGNRERVKSIEQSLSYEGRLTIRTKSSTICTEAENVYWVKRSQTAPAHHKQA
jgi:hypothetical protein